MHRSSAIRLGHSTIAPARVGRAWRRVLWSNEILGFSSGVDQFSTPCLLIAPFLLQVHGYLETLCFGKPILT